MKAVRILLLVVLAGLAVVLLSPAQAEAQGNQDRHPVEVTGDDSGGVAPEATANLARYLSVVQKGGYVAKGVGLRSGGSGDIVISGIPAGAAVTHAILYWNVFHNVKAPADGQGIFDGHPIVGTLVGSAVADFPYVAGDKTWSYRASVKSFMFPGGNGTYHLSGFPVGPNGDPRIMGATLVVLFSKPNYPLTTLQIYNGAVPSPYGANRTLRLQVTNIAAVAPSGMASTTFIGADGMPGVGAVSTFNTTVLPTVTWQGAEGQYWDTMTVDVHSLVEPPENGFWLSSKVPNGATWVAQVVSYSSGSQDTDGDGLLDGWELNGVDTNGDGIIDLALNAPPYSADPFHKDLFVEADYMIDPDGEDHLPTAAALSNIVSVFQNAPVTNPDGTSGIRIHLDTGGRVHGGGFDSAFNLGGGNDVGYLEHIGAITSTGQMDWSQFDLKKNANFNPRRVRIFHYMIFAHDLFVDPYSISGISRNGPTDALFIKGAHDFIVTMGSWPIEGADYERMGTFIHELGHNLGLRHGGNDHLNYKPNYLSIMNYLYQTSGLWRDGGIVYDYSRNVVPTLNEAALNEVTGLGAAAANHGVRWICPGGSIVGDTTAGSNVDWDCDGPATYHSMTYDVNHDGKVTTFGNQNNWANITFKGGGLIGSSSLEALPAPQFTRWIQELTYEEHLKIYTDAPVWK